MKISLILFQIAIFTVLFCSRVKSQDTLPTVTVLSLNFKYLRAVSDPNAPKHVKMLEHKAASYNVKSADFYEDMFDEYNVSFYIPDGEILAVYDKDGKIIRSAEKFKNIVLPQPVRQAVEKRFYGWIISKDVYLVNYYPDGENAKKLYKMTLENGNKQIKIKTTETGEFVD